jgi:hypothetical protein
MMIRRVVFLVLLSLAAIPAIPVVALAAQGEIELFSPSREAQSAIQAARLAGASELASEDLRLADLYRQDATAALRSASGPSEVKKAARLFRLAAAEARLAETRAIEVTRDREAADGGRDSSMLSRGEP